MHTNLNTPRGTKIMGDHGKSAEDNNVLPTYYAPREYVYGASRLSLRPSVPLEEN